MAGFAEFERYDAIGLATLVRDKQISASELLDAAIERVESRNAAVNTVVSRLYDEARRAIDAGLPDGPFTGVPFLLKDIGATLAGTATTLGSRMFATFVADHDSELVARYRRSGLAIFGKTNTPEFGIVSTTEPQLFGPTKNPWNLAHSPGGSSGGAAAAVASGMVPAAHGNDGGGSIRIPASCCGLFGLKPTRARTPMGPDVGEGWGGMAVSHAITRTVRDSAALLDATAGPMSAIRTGRRRPRVRSSRKSAWIPGACASRCAPSPGTAHRSTPSARTRSPRRRSSPRAWATSSTKHARRSTCARSRRRSG